MDAVGDLLRLVGIALIDRRYDLLISRRLKLIPEHLEVGGGLGVGACYAGKDGVQLGACVLHLRVQRILCGFVLGIYHRIQRGTRACERRAGTVVFGLGLVSVAWADSASDRQLL